MKNILTKTTAVFVSIILMNAAVVSFIFNSSRVQAAQLTNKKVTMSSSSPSATNTTYTISYANATAGTVQGIVVDFCTNILQGSVCTAPSGLSLTAVTPQTIDSVSFTQTITNSTRLTMNSATGSTASVAEVYTFTVTATNPSTVGTFYARIFTYAVSATATAYTSSAPGSYVDNGNVALSTSNDINLSGVMLETLDFCVGADDGTPAASDTNIQNCSSSGFATGQTVGLGVISTLAVSTPVTTANGGTFTNGAFAVRTNAIGGATVGYRAVQSSSTGKFKLPGATSATCASNTVSDGCFNSSGTTANTLNGEEFGMAVSQIIYPTSQSTATANLVRDAEYDFTNSNEYAWDDTGSYDQVATSTGSATKVMDWEVGILKFGAISSPTTPNGAYSVSANFVATTTF